jgi:hypothetical protein
VKISYAIPVCNEHVELEKLLSFLTQEHINKWRWNVNEKGWVNWPDYQTRIIQNSPKIKWQNKVHEQIVGISTRGVLPTEEEWCLYHPKTIGRQETQNRFYDSL